MALVDLIPKLSDKELANLRDNAQRLSQSGAPKQQIDAADALPLIIAEIATRKANAPPPAKRASTRKKAVPAVEPEASDEDASDQDD
jgi:hypothetical protein